MKAFSFSLLVFVLFSCTIEPEPPINALKKSVPFNCESGANFITMCDTNIIDRNDYFTLKEKNFYVITNMSNRLYNIDLNSLKIIKEKEIPVMPNVSTSCGDSKWWIVNNIDFHSTAIKVCLLDTLGHISTTSDIIEDSVQNISIASTSDNGFILALPLYKSKFNYTDPNGDMRIIRYDKDAKVIWDKTFSKIFGFGINYKAIEVTDGYLIGSLLKEGTSNNATLIKLNRNGDKLWQKTVLMQNNPYGNTVRDIRELPSKNYAVIVTGLAYDNYILKTDSAGNILWKSEQIFQSAVMTINANGEIMVGSTQNNPAYQNTKDIVLTCISEDGKIKWKEVYIGGSGDEVPIDILQMPSGYFIVGQATSYTGTGEYHFVDKNKSQYFNFYTIKDYYIKTDLQGKTCSN